MPKRILVTGASGLLGSRIIEIGADLGLNMYASYNDHVLKRANSIKIDLQNADQVNDALNSVKPNFVIHCAALSDVDKCEIENDLAWRINVGGTNSLIKASVSVGASLIYVSTDYVFKGDRGEYKEEDNTGPINYYGYTKLQAEKLVENIQGNWVIIRPSVIYGSVPAAGKINFVLWLINKLQKKEHVNIITDQRVSPTLNTNLAQMILEIVERRLTGVYHLAGANQINRYDFALKIAKEFHLDEKFINPVFSKDMNWAAKRPMDSSLDVNKASKTLNVKPMMIQEALSMLRKEIETRKSEE